MQLRIMTWNCQSFRNKIPELSQFLKDNFFHVILIQESWLNTKVSFKIPNFISVRKDRAANSQNPHGGVMILIHESIKYQVVNFCNVNSIESIFIKIFVDSRHFTIGSVYSPSSLTKAQAKFDLAKLLALPGPVILAGDFNAKHTNWNNLNSNAKGYDLQKLCNDNLFEISNPDSPTLYPGVGEPSIVDFVLSKGIFGISKPISINDLSSDHLPVEFNIPFFAQLPEELKIPNFKKANWKEFRRQIEINLHAHTTSEPEFNSFDELDSHIQAFSTIVLKAEKVSIPLKKPYIFRYPFSQEINDLKTKRNIYRKASERIPALKKVTNALNREIKLKTAKLNSDSFNEKLASLKTADLSVSFRESNQKKESCDSPTEIV